MREGHRAEGLIRAFAIEPLYTYDAVFEGFAAVLTPQQVLALRRNPHVESIEDDGAVEGTSFWKTQNTRPLDPNGDPWGIDRIDQLSPRLTGTYRYMGTGEGVTVYILDTGIDYSHPDLGKRAVPGYDAFGGNGQDRQGHGTHVAATVGGNFCGVANGVRLVSVKVLDDSGNGTWSGIIAGLDWIAKNRKGPSVANMSLGGGKNTSVNAAVKKLVDADVTVVVAAGNNGINACNASPASEPSAITVGASTRRDYIPAWSNFGSCVDIFAPGVDIFSAVPGGYYDIYSGTSMAAPHVAGVVALLMASTAGPGELAAAMPPKDVRKWLVDNALNGRLRGFRSGDTDRLLYKARL
jgi:subtilisin family serine protease